MTPSTRSHQWEPDQTLPCDVRLPPATVIRAGCKLSTLIHALELRGMAAPTPPEGHNGE